MRKGRQTREGKLNCREDKGYFLCGEERTGREKFLTKSHKGKISNSALIHSDDYSSNLAGQRVYSLYERQMIHADVCAVVRERVIYAETKKLPELSLPGLLMNRSAHNFYNENHSQLYLSQTEFCSIKLLDSFLHFCHDPTNLKKDETHTLN